MDSHFSTILILLLAGTVAVYMNKENDGSRVKRFWNKKPKPKNPLNQLKNQWEMIMKKVKNSIRDLQVYYSASKVIANMFALRTDKGFHEATSDKRRIAVCSGGSSGTSCTNSMHNSAKTQQLARQLQASIGEDNQRQSDSARNITAIEKDSRRSDAKKIFLHDAHTSKRNAFPRTNRGRCIKRGNFEADSGTKTLCHECNAITDLGPDRFPRFLNEIICDVSDTGCLGHQGRCVQNVLYMKFKWDAQKVGLLKVHFWPEYHQAVRHGCHCQLYSQSAFDPFTNL